MAKEHKNETSVTSLGLSCSIININYSASDVQHATDLQMKRDEQKRIGTFLVTWYTSFVRNNPTQTDQFFG